MNKENRTEIKDTEIHIKLITDEEKVVKTILTFDISLDRLKEFPVWILKSDKGEYVSRTPVGTEEVKQFLLRNGISVTKSKELRISSVGTIGNVNVIFKDDHTIEYTSLDNRTARIKAEDIKKELSNAKITYFKCETISILEEKETCKKELGIKDAWMQGMENESKNE